MPRDRFASTTSQMLDAAERIALSHGISALTLERVGIDSYSSTGSVYERWSSRRDLLHDLINHRALPHVSATMRSVQHRPLAEQINYLEASTEGSIAATWLVEVLHLARDDAEFVEHARGALLIVADRCTVGDGLFSNYPVDRGTQWWLLSIIVGFAQLRLGCARMPSLATAVAHLVSTPYTGRARRRNPKRTRRRDETSQAPVSSTASSTYFADDVAKRILGTTRTLLADSSRAPSMRQVITRTRVSPKSIYERFESRRGLMIALLQDELRRQSSNWGDALVSSLNSDDPVGALAKVFRQRFETLTLDPASRNVILGLTAQARTDDVLRRKLIAQVETMAERRAEFFAMIHAAGALHQRLTAQQCGWLLQVSPAGFRLMIGSGIDIDADDFEAGQSRVFWNVLQF